MCKATTFDLASLFISAAAHDMDHPGHNNLFETKTHSKLATLYNDQAVLENHHAASLFFLVEDEQCSIFTKFNAEENNRMRKYIVENILYTDMSKHFGFLNEIKQI
jgi:3'5'-cyclic nucleotide phosphodiesterase